MSYVHVEACLFSHSENAFWRLLTLLQSEQVQVKDGMLALMYGLICPLQLEHLTKIPFLGM